MFTNNPSNVPLYSVVESEMPAGGLESEKNSPQKERRNRSKPVPLNMGEYLNQDQTLSLRQMESFGWQIAFIRRPLFQDPVVIVTNNDQSKYGVLEQDGSINVDAMITLRH
ncbi:hypothetical protein SAMN02745866_03281 [Alteromonadaceae bacterium Bs31]|nr:hypothetical protein SAMN02745866_03281 [Alteromonadaceae bacterium Bs31]